MSTGDPKSLLKDDLEQDRQELFDGGRFNNIADVALSVAAVLASLVATVLAAAKVDPAWIAAAVAAIPAAASAAQSRIDPRGRSVWYFRYAARVEALETELKYAREPDIEEFGRRRAAITTEMESDWTKIGRAAHAPSKKARP